MRLPTAREINPFPKDLDGKCAEKHFLDQTLEDAEKMFHEYPLIYLEDLMWMGPVAFRFYVPAAINYIKSDAATGDSSIIDGFTGLLLHRLTSEDKELIPIASQLASASRYILENYDKFDLTPEIYGDLRPRLETLERSFLQQSGA